MVRYAASADRGFEVFNSVPDASRYVQYSAPLYKTSLKARGRIAYERGPGINAFEFMALFFVVFLKKNCFAFRFLVFRCLVFHCFLKNNCLVFRCYLSVLVKLIPFKKFEFLFSFPGRQYKFISAGPDQRRSEST